MELMDSTTAKCQVCGAVGDFRGSSGIKIVSVRRLGLANACLPCAKAAVEVNPPSTAERKRIKRNSAARERYSALRSLGMVKTPYGWE
jgi:hypothetical protein